MGWATAVQIGLPLAFPASLGSHEKNGSVYTKPWVVDLILDLAGYNAETNLVDTLTVEPAAGDGAFVVPMLKRLLASCRRQRRPLQHLASSLLIYELDQTSAERARHAVAALLVQQGIAEHEASRIAAGWIQTGDYLLDAPSLPPADFVIGNPPYIRLEDMNDYVAAAYRAAYSAMKGRADIYVAFFEAALRQLKSGGVCAYICADRWMFNQYGAELRRLITAGFSVETIIEMHRADAFASDVSAYPAITVIRRAKQGPVVVATADTALEVAESTVLAQSLTAQRVRTSEFGFSNGLSAALVETWFHDDDPWPWVSPERLSLLKRLEQEFLPLETAVTGTKVGIGVATGLDDVFITTDEDLVEPLHLLPLAMASDTLDGKLCWSSHYLVNPWDHAGLVNLDQSPRLKAYCERHRERLQQRHVSKRNPRQWYRTIDRVNHDLIPQHKLYIPDIKDRIAPVLDEGQTYPHHNLYFITSDRWNLEVLGGLLLSDVGQFFIECYAVRMRGGYLRFQAQYLRRIHVPDPDSISASQAAGLIAAFRRRDVVAATYIAQELYRIHALPMSDHDRR